MSNGRDFARFRGGGMSYGRHIGLWSKSRGAQKMTQSSFAASTRSWPHPQSSKM